MANYFKGSTTEDAVGYLCGEEMVFELTLVHDDKPFGVPLFKWESFGDDGAHSSGFAPGETGKIRFSTSCAAPGFAHVFVYACSLDGKPIPGIDKFEGGAGAEIDKIEQGIDDPDDYDEFWARQVELVNSTELEVLYKKEIDSGNPDYVCYDIRLNAPGDMPASGKLTMPKNAAPGSLNAMIRFHGYGFAESDIVRVPGAAVFHMNVHGFENCREPEYYTEFSKTHAGFGFNKEENQSPETCYFRNVILRDLQGARFVTSLPEYNGKGLDVGGGSMGAMRATNVAANIDYARCLDIFVPWLCDLGGILGENGRPKRLHGWRPDIEPAVLYFDTVNAAKRVKCPVKIGCGLGDYICPPSGQVVLWHNFKTEKSIRFVQNMTHPYRPIDIIEYSR